MFSLLFILAASPGVNSQGQMDRAMHSTNVRVRRAGGRARSVSYAFFEFAPVTGAGMGTACACTTPTGAAGEVLTFTRASSGTCLKSTSATNIANGDLVTCSANQPRVMPGYDPSGVLGLLVESSRTNSLLQSQALDNAAWISTGSTFAPTVTANAGTAPDGTLTAERVDYPVTAAAQTSGLYQTVGSGSYVTTFFVRGVTGVSDTGTIDVCWSLVSTACTPCAFTSSAWSRCTRGPDTTTTPLIGSVAAAGRPAQSVYVWGAQTEVGAYATSYIATTTVAVTRSADSASFVNSAPITQGSTAMSVVPEWSTGANALWYGISWGGSAEGPYSVGTDTRCYDGTTQVIQTGVTYSPTVASRLWCSWSGATMIAGFGGTSTSGAFDGTMGTGIPSVSIGSFSGTNALDGVSKQICVDPSPTRCR